MKFDDILQQQVGELGRHQKILVLMLSMVMCSAGVQIMITVFTLHAPNYRCADPAVDNDSYTGPGPDSSVQRELSQGHGTTVQYKLSECYIDYAGLRNHDGSPKNLSEFDKDWLPHNDKWLLDDSASGSNFSTRAECRQWVYDQSVFASTMSTQMNFVCDRKILSSHAVMFLMVGQMIGAVFGGSAADFVGRKKLMMIMLLVHFVVSVLTTWVTDIYTLGTVYLLNGLAIASAYCAAFTLTLELVGPRWRHVVGIFITSTWSFGILYVGMLSFFIREWHLLQLAASLPAAFFVFFLCFVPESARWLARKGRYSEAEKILEHIARRNGNKLAAKIDLGNDVIEESQQSQSLVMFLRCPPLLVRLIVVLFNWFACSLTYYGLSLNVGHLFGNIHLNFCLSGIFELIGFAMVVLLLSRVGRKKIYCYSLIVGGMGCLLTVIPVLIGGEWSVHGVRALAMTGKFGIASAFAILWLYTPEMFPTSLRAGVTGASSCSARLGGVAASYLANLTLKGNVGHLLPQIIFGTLGLMAGLCALTLPETNQVRLPDSMDDAVQMKKHVLEQDKKDNQESLLT
ncbi:hypothetical protein RRG08_065556 [Elysia crispata]|uniref:Major facilitator superfamily (MFS) profile domain-containing protein n=1 Tax=Elysia crispata TaxID=231223 RepID=A0AAE1D468_9GAST|nr:hypothetical protein RRG08_065556 [Elysia crispata]